MCYNKDVSIYTYIIGLVSSYLLLTNEKKSLKIIGCFFIVVIQMQLVEYFLWNNIKCNSKNITISNINTFILFYYTFAHLKRRQRRILPSKLCQFFTTI